MGCPGLTITLSTSAMPGVMRFRGDQPPRFVLTSSRSGRVSMPVLPANATKLPTCSVESRQRSVRGSERKRDGNYEGPCPGACPDGCLHRRCHRRRMVGREDTGGVAHLGIGGFDRIGWNFAAPWLAGRSGSVKPYVNRITSSVAQMIHPSQPNEEIKESD